MMGGMVGMNRPMGGILGTPMLGYGGGAAMESYGLGGGGIMGEMRMQQQGGVVLLVSNLPDEVTCHFHLEIIVQAVPLQSRERIRNCFLFNCGVFLKEEKGILLIKDDWLLIHAACPVANLHCVY